MSVDAVIFDLDDTLIDWWGSIDTCLRRLADDPVADALFEHCRRELWQLDPTGRFVWHRDTWALHHFRDRHWPTALPEHDPAELALLMRAFDAELWVGFFADAVPCLDALVDRTRLAVLSNNVFVHAEAARLRLSEWFEGWDHAPPDARKPDPAAFAPALAALGLPPERCAYVGDSVKADVLGALGAGLVPVWLDRWGDAWENRPTPVRRIGSLDELPGLLDQLGA